MQLFIIIIMFFIPVLGRENLQQQPDRTPPLPCQGTDHYILPFTNPQPELHQRPCPSIKHPYR